MPITPSLLALVSFGLVAAPTESVDTIRIKPSSGARVELVLDPPARIVVPAGTFRMGANRTQLQRIEDLCARDLRATGALEAQLVPHCRLRSDIEGPAIDVLVPAFGIDRLEVTRAEYQECVVKGACRALPPWTGH